MPDSSPAPRMHNSSTELSVADRLDKLYEFERAPVTEDRLHSGRYFAGLFAGEHVAATEFIIGALFVKWGVSARDLLLGLLLGNALAVLSWAFICAPIAVRTRLTLYWYARGVIGPGLTVIYNVVNAMLYCCLAAAMIGVSGSAVILALSKIGLHLKHPELNDIYPNSVGWVLVVLAVGGVTIILAIAGFKKLSQFASVCSPWMFLVFIAGALATLPALGQVHSLKDLWTVAETKIWLPEPRPGTDSLKFWHITFFAWFCNLAMHVGLSDMAIFRYAKKWSYGFYSAFGMYLGHYLAWICAGVMGAVIGNELNPGKMADSAAGMAGVLAVLVAGWTTANPTIYRAGLALQIATPNWPRWLITIVAGGITTIVGFFPVIFMRLLDFVALYGLSLMPIGAILFTEHWLFPKLGMRQYWATHRKVFMNMPALITWVVVFAVCFPWEQFTGFRSPMELAGVHLFFRWLPGWFLSVILYVAICKLVNTSPVKGSETPSVTPARPAFPVQSGGESDRRSSLESSSQPEVHAGRPGSSAPRGLTPLAKMAGAVALVALVACLALPIWVFLGGTDAEVYGARLGTYKTWLLVATVVYFAGAVVYSGQREKAAA